MKKFLKILGLVAIVVIAFIAWKNAGPLFSNSTDNRQGGPTVTDTNTALGPGSRTQTDGGTTQSTGSQTSAPATKTQVKTGTETNTNPGNVTPSYPRQQVNYTDTGFQPISAIVHVGQTVRFMNQGPYQLWVVPSIDYPGFGQTAPVDRGDYYDFTFTKIGTWRYYNKADPRATGTIIVK